MAVLISDAGGLKTYQRDDESTFVVPSTHVSQSQPVDPNLNLNDVEIPAGVVSPVADAPVQVAPLVTESPARQEDLSTVTPDALSGPDSSLMDISTSEDLVQPESSVLPIDVSIPTDQASVNEQLNAANKAKLDAANAIAEADVKEAQAKNTVLEQQKAIEEAAAEETARIDAENKVVIDESTAKIAETTENFKNAKIDSNDWWGRKSDGNKALSILGLFMMEFVKPQSGIAMMNRLVDQNIDAQKTNIDNLGRSIQFERSALSDIRTQFRDEGLARIAAKETTLKKLGLDLQIASNTATSEKSKANLLLASNEVLESAANFGQQRIDIETQLKAQDRARRSANARSRRAAKLNKRKQDFAERKYDEGRADAKRAAESTQVSKTDFDKLPGYGRVQNPSTGKAIGKYKADDKTVHREFDKRTATRATTVAEVIAQKQIFQKTGAMYDGPMSEFIQSDEQKALVTRNKAAMMAKLKAMSGTAASDSEKQAIADLMGRVETWTSGDPTPIWDEILSITREAQMRDNNQNIMSGTNTWDVEKDWATPKFDEQYIGDLKEESVGILSSMSPPPGVDRKQWNKDNDQAVNDLYKINLKNRKSGAAELARVGVEQVGRVHELSKKKSSLFEQNNLTSTGNVTKDLASIKKASRSGSITAKIEDELTAITLDVRDGTRVSHRIAANYSKLKGRRPKKEQDKIDQIEKQSRGGVSGKILSMFD